MRKLLLVSIFCAVFLGSDGRFTNRCERLKVDYEITASLDGKWDLKVSAEGENKPYNYVLCFEDGSLVVSEFDKDSFSGIASGNYWLIVTTSNGCHKKVKISAK